MQKRALCAFDTKRFLLENGYDTLAYGHKDITHDVVQEQIENPGGDIILTAKQARDSGLVWSRRKGVDKRLGMTHVYNGEENEQEALAAGKALREKTRKRLEEVIDIPEKLIPQELRPVAHRKPAKHPRMRIDSEEDSCSITKKRSLLRIDSDDESPFVPNQTVDAQPVSFQNSPSTTEKIPKSMEIYSGPNRTTSKKSSGVRSFFLEEAEEAKNEDEDEAWPVRRCSSSLSRSHFETTDEDSEGEADSDDSFMVGDDIFD